MLGSHNKHNANEISVRMYEVALRYYQASIKLANVLLYAPHKLEEAAQEVMGCSYTYEAVVHSYLRSLETVQYSHLEREAAMKRLEQIYAYRQAMTRQYNTLQNTLLQ